MVLSNFYQTPSVAKNYRSLSIKKVSNISKTTKNFDELQNKKGKFINVLKLWTIGKKSQVSNG